MSRIIFILPFLFLSLLSLSATVIVKGTAASYTGQYISLFAFDDLLTGKRILLQSDLIDDNGTFEITCEIAETQKTILAINNVEAVLYVEPGLTYTIDYPPFQTADLQRFDRTEIQLKVHYLPDNDLNLLIRSFDAEMNSFFNEHYFEIAEEQYRGSEAFKVRQLHNGSAPDMIPVKKIGESDSSLKVVAPTRKAELINGFYKRVDQRFGRYLTHHYFSEYVRYSKAQIDLVSGKSKKELYREYFMSQKVQFSNPAYFQFFESFYSHILSGHPFEKQEEIYKAVNANKNASLLAAVFETDSLFFSENIRNMAMIKGLKEVYYDANFLQPSVSATLESFATTANSPEIKRMALNTVMNLRKAKSGWKLEDFTLLDLQNEKWSLSENGGKYIYFIFFANWCSPCVKEMQILEKYYPSYYREIDFIAIGMDNNYNEFVKYIQQHSTQKFTFLFGGSDPLLREKFNLRALPHAALIAPDGTFVSDYTRKPGEGANLDFEKIKSLSEKKKGSGTWKN